jgi:hypothetical protein
MDQHWDLGMREHFDRVAAEYDRGDAVTLQALSQTQPPTAPHTNSGGRIIRKTG